MSIATVNQPVGMYPKLWVTVNWESAIAGVVVSPHAPLMLIGPLVGLPNSKLPFTANNTLLRIRFWGVATFSGGDETIPLGGG